MAHIDKKVKTLSVYGQYIVLHNKDLLALISRFLVWRDIASFVRCCKCWNDSFLSRRWGTPPFIKLVNETSFRYVKFVKQVKLLTSEPTQLNLVSQLKPRKISLVVNGDHNLDMLDHLHCFSSLSISSHLQMPDVLVRLNRFVAIHASHIQKLDIQWLLGSVALPIMPELTVLSASTVNVLFNDAYWPVLQIIPDPNFSNVMIDLRHLSSRCPKLSTFELLYHHDLIAPMDTLFANVGLLFMELIKHSFEQLIIRESETIEENIISPLFVWLHILIQSRTLKKVMIYLDCAFTNGDGYRFSKELKDWGCQLIIRDRHKVRRSNI